MTQAGKINQRRTLRTALWGVSIFNVQKVEEEAEGQLEAQKENLESEEFQGT